MDEITCAEIKLWKSNRYSATGNLVYSPIANYSRFRRGTLQTVRADIQNGNMVHDKDFSSGLIILNSIAENRSIKISVNQVLRILGASVSGAVVTPAQRSQHLIGHAIDVNIIEGSTTYVSANYANNTISQNVRGFIADVRNQGLRWGGDFGAPQSSSFDPPHIMTYKSIPIH